MPAQEVCCFPFAIHFSRQLYASANRQKEEENAIKFVNGTNPMQDIMRRYNCIYRCNEISLEVLKCRFIYSQTWRGLDYLEV